MVFVMADPARRGGRVQIDAGLAALEGELLSPLHPVGLVVLPTVGEPQRRAANQVAAALQPVGLAALRVDLLTGAEREYDVCGGDLSADRNFLAERISGIATWALEHFAPGPSGGHRVGCFASGSTADAARLALSCPILTPAGDGDDPDGAQRAAEWLAAQLAPH